MSDEQIIANTLTRLMEVCVRCGERFLPATGKTMRCLKCAEKRYPVRQKEASV